MYYTTINNYKNNNVNYNDYSLPKSPYAFEYNEIIC